jgi:hypothetical protein
VYQILRDYRYQSIFSDQEWPRRIDTFALQQLLGQRFPALLDDAYRAELARRQAQPVPLPTIPPPVPPSLLVTNTLLFPPAPGISHGEHSYHVWHGDQLRLGWGNEHICLDPVTKTFRVIGPPPERDYPGHGAWSIAGIGESLLFYAKHFDLDADNLGTWFAWRPLTGGEWRTARLTFPAGGPAQVGRKLYFTTSAPRIVTYQSNGLIEFDTETLQATTLRVPGTPFPKRDKTTPLAFEHLSFGYGARDGLLLSKAGQQLYGWDPVTKAVRSLTEARLRGSRFLVETNSLACGFAIVRNEYGIAMDITAADRLQLQVLPTGHAQPITIPLALPAADRPVAVSCGYAATFTGATALYAVMHQHRGLYIIPYADIQQWLAANSREVNKPASKAGESAPVAPTPKGK